MKTTFLTNPLFRVKPLTRFALGLGLSAGLASVPLHADEDDNIPAGYTEDEWYDPGDWFDGNNIEPAGTDWWDTDWHDTYDYNYSVGVRPYHYYYYWDPVVVRWLTLSGPDSTTNDDKKANTGRNNDSGNQRSTTAGTDKSKVLFDGTVDGFKKVNLQAGDGREEESTFVRVRLKNGESRVVNLGSRIDLATLDLKKGDEIRVTGRNQRVDDRNVLAAERISVEDQTFRVHGRNKNQVEIQGTLKEFTRTSLDGAKEKNLLIRLELENGKNCVVDLGRGTSLSDLELEQGAEIRLQGERTTVDGKSLIVARKISVDDDTTRIRDRQDSKQGDSNDQNDQSAGNDRDAYDRDSVDRSLSADN